MPGLKETLEIFIQTHGALAVFLVGILEEVLFVIPSSLVFLGSGFVLIPSTATFVTAFPYAVFKIGIPAAIGVTLGSLFVYGLVYAGGKPFILRYGKYFGITWEEIESAEKRFAKGYKDEVILFVLRAVPIFPISLISAVCGLVRLPWKEFLYVTFTGAFVRVVGSALVGWAVGKEYAYYAGQFEVVEKYGLIFLIAVAIIAYWYVKKRLRKI